MKKFYILVILGGLMFGGCSTDKVVQDTEDYAMGSFVTSKIKAKLVKTVGLESFNINVRTYDDQIILTGVVDTQKQVYLAGSVARSVNGARRVRNHITIK